MNAGGDLQASFQTMENTAESLFTPNYEKSDLI